MERKLIVWYFSPVLEKLEFKKFIANYWKKFHDCSAIIIQGNNKYMKYLSFVLIRISMISIWELKNIIHIIYIYNRVSIYLLFLIHYWLFTTFCRCNNCINFYFHRSKINSSRKINWHRKSYSKSILPRNNGQSNMIEKSRKSIIS